MTRWAATLAAALSLTLLATGTTALDDASAAQPPPRGTGEIAIIPKPVALQRERGHFGLSPQSQIEAPGAARPVGDYLAAILRRSTGYRLPVVDHAGTSAPITIRLGPDLAPTGHRDEGYHLRAQSSGISITASTYAGALNAVQTLRQLLPQWIESRQPLQHEWIVPNVAITDYPRFSHRGIGIDVARSFYTVAEIKAQIDAAAQFKMNRLHLHLTDDQAWRIALNNPDHNPSKIDYTRLTSVSGHTAMTRNDNGQLMGTELGHTGWYTEQDYRDIVAYAAKNAMIVIPEIDMPGHVNAALHAVPQLNTANANPKPASGEATPPANGTPDVGYSTFDADSPVTYEFTRQVLTQISAMTPGPYLHIGGDEAHVTPHARYQKMIDTFARQTSDLGKTVIGWNEYATGNLPKHSVIQYWNGDKQAFADEVLRNDAHVILSPADRTYVPQKQDEQQPQGGTWACGGPCTLQHWYDWDPGSYLPGLPQSSVLGVEAVTWGEFIRGNAQAFYYQFPRTLATAEVGWSQQDDRSYDDYRHRVATLGGRLTLEDVNFFPTPDIPDDAQNSDMHDSSEP